jgi:MoaA/NifB/PqqE/SkfB family radical SAM enzyme
MRRLSADKRYWNSALNFREFWQGRLRLSAYPRMIQLGATMACNLRCFFCMRTVEAVRERHAQLKSRLEREIPPAVFDQAVEFMPYVETFDLTPFGENFLYSNFDRLLELHARLDCRNITLTTSGTLIAPERADLIVRSRVQQVKISLEEADPDLYADMRRGAKLESVVEGIRLLTECKQRRQSLVPRLTLAASYMRRNIERLPDMIRFAAAHGVPEVYVQMLELKYHDDPDVRNEELTYHIPLLRRMIAEGESEARRLGITYVVTYPIYALLQAEAGEAEVRGERREEEEVRGERREVRGERREEEEVRGERQEARDGSLEANAVARPEGRAQNDVRGERREVRGRTFAANAVARPEGRRRHIPITHKCTNPWWWAYIDENGYMWPCCWAKVHFGNLQQQPFMDVWNSPVAQDMRRRFLADDLPPYCRGQLCHMDFE